MLAEARIVIVMTKISTGRSPGSVTWRNCCHALGAVERGGLVELARDVLQAGQVDDRVEAERPPDGHPDQRDPGPRLVVGPRRSSGRPNSAEEGVQRCRSWCRACSATSAPMTATPSTYGAKKTARKNVAAGELRLSSIASASGTTTRNGTLSTVKIAGRPHAVPERLGRDRRPGRTGPCSSAARRTACPAAGSPSRAGSSTARRTPAPMHEHQRTARGTAPGTGTAWPGRTRGRRRRPVVRGVRRRVAPTSRSTGRPSGAVLLAVRLQDLVRLGGRVGQRLGRLLLQQHGLVDRLVQLGQRVTDPRHRRREVQVVDLRGQRRLLRQRLELAPTRGPACGPAPGRPWPTPATSG